MGDEVLVLCGPIRPMKDEQKESRVPRCCCARHGGTRPNDNQHLVPQFDLDILHVKTLASLHTRLAAPAVLRYFSFTKRRTKIAQIPTVTGN